MWLVLALVLASICDPSSVVPGRALDRPIAPRTARLARLECVSGSAVEVEVTAVEPFPVRNALTELKVGRVVSSLSRFPDGGDTHTLIFTLTPDELLSVSISDRAVVRFNPGNDRDVWLVGSLDPTIAHHCEADR